MKVIFGNFLVDMVSNPITIFIVIGILASVLFRFVLRKKFIGGIYIAFIVGIVGSILGSSSIILSPVTDFLIDLKDFFTYNFNINNIYGPIIGSCLFVWIYSLISSGFDKKD